MFPSRELRSYAVCNLETGVTEAVDLKTKSGKIVRRIRLERRVLMVEWCEDEAVCRKDEGEIVYRHFATAYDLIRGPGTGKWDLVFRLL